MSEAAALRICHRQSWQTNWHLGPNQMLPAVISQVITTNPVIEQSFKMDLYCWEKKGNLIIKNLAQFILSAALLDPVGFTALLASLRDQKRVRQTQKC